MGLHQAVVAEVASVGDAELFFFCLSSFIFAPSCSPVLCACSSRLPRSSWAPAAIKSRALRFALPMAPSLGSWGPLPALAFLPGSESSSSPRCWRWFLGPPAVRLLGVRLLRAGHGSKWQQNAVQSAVWCCRGTGGKALSVPSWRKGSGGCVMSGREA